MKDLLFLDKMVVPKIITFIYWLALIAAVVSGIGMMTSPYGNFFYGLLVMVFGIIGARIWSELVIVLFRINEALQDIRKK